MAESVLCALFIDDKPSPEICLFVAVPRVGETILAPSDGFERTVENVKHLAQGALADRPEPHVQIYARMARPEDPEAVK
jgi:hypothetical protein